MEVFWTLSAVSALVLYFFRNPKVLLALYSHEKIFVVFGIRIFASMCGEAGVVSWSRVIPPGWRALCKSSSGHPRCGVV